MLDFRIRAYPGEPVRRYPIGVSVLLGTIFLFAYLVIYVIAPHLSIYSMIGLLVVGLLAGIGVRVREMMRGVGKPHVRFCEGAHSNLKVTDCGGMCSYRALLDNLRPHSALLWSPPYPASIHGFPGKLREDDQYRRSDCDKPDEQVYDQVIRFYFASDDRKSHTLCAEWKPQRYAARVQRIHDQVQDHRERCKSRVKVGLPDRKHDSTGKECKSKCVRDPAVPNRRDVDIEVADHRPEYSPEEGDKRI